MHGPRRHDSRKGISDNMTRFTNVLVDLDGTLTDPFEGIAASIRHAMNGMGLKTPSDDDVRRAIGPPLRQTFGNLLATREASRIEEALRLYRERFSVTGLLENRVYPGLSEMLANLDMVGCRLFVATSKPSVYAQKIVDHFGLTQYFVAVYGSNFDGRLENKADLIHHLLDSEHLAARDTVMVGDRSQDMLGAKAHGLSAIGVTWGYGSRKELEDAGADVICSSPTEVCRFLTES